MLKMNRNTKVHGEHNHLIYRKRLIAFPFHWLFQGISQADKTEIAFRIFIDISLMLILFWGFINFTTITISALLAAVIAHTFNATFNGQMYVVARHFGKSRTVKDLTDYIKELKGRISKEESIQAAAIYGSFSRGEAKESSDVDVRVIRRRGIINGMKGCLFGFLERSKAFINKIPLDLYVLDSTKRLSNFRDDEIPLVLYDPEEIFATLYQQVNYLENELRNG